MLRILAPTFALALAVLANTTAEARTKLVTVPDRADLVISLENPRAALLFEERDIALQKGTNLIDFSWKGVSIDQASVLLEVLTHPGETADSTRIIATGFPPNEAALTWEVFSPEARTERIRVSYLLRGISQQNSYEFTVNTDETKGDFQHHLVLRNTSGENLRNATLRLPGMDDIRRDVETGEARRFLAQRQRELPLQKLYVARPSWRGFRGDDGETIALVYELKNDKASGLGRGTLPAGKIRLFADDGDNSTIFLGEDNLALTAPGERAQPTLGTVRDITLKRYLANERRQNERFTTNRTLSVFDLERTIRYEVQNFKDKPTTVRIHEPMRGDWEVVSITGATVRTERRSINELELEIVDLPAAPNAGTEPPKTNVILTVRIRNVFPGEI